MLLVHSFGWCALEFFLLKEKTGFYFADKGFDVWAMNFRGNLYNLSHKNQNITYQEFFDFGFDEIGKIDIPTCIDNILKITKKPKLTLHANSVGCFSSVIALTDKSVCQQVDQVLFTAPCLFLSCHKEPRWEQDCYTWDGVNLIEKTIREMNTHHTNFGNFYSDKLISTAFYTYIDSVIPGMDLSKGD